MTDFQKNNEISRFDDINFTKLGFGKYFSDHIIDIRHENGKWGNLEIKKYGSVDFEPSMCTLHYGQTIFEGLKAYKDFEKGGVNLFRPNMNAQRLRNSAERLCIEEIPDELFIESCIEIVKKDRKFIPQNYGESLYLRPLLFGDGNFLGVHASETFRFMVMCSPVANYYEEGLKPIKILVPDNFSRTVTGGLGAAKTASNYAATLYAVQMARKQGFTQVLWLDGATKQYVDEVGAMNIVFVIDNEIITPPLDEGTILAGVTRDTVLKLAAEFGIKYSERKISISEVYEAHKSGKLTEVFGTGTAAVISPVGLLSYKGESITINNFEIGPISQKMYDTITGIQHGKIEDKWGWNLHLDI